MDKQANDTNTVILYGMGKMLDVINSYGKQFELLLGKKVIALTDRETELISDTYTLWGDDVPVISLSEISSECNFFITSIRYYDEIKRNLISRGVKKEKIYDTVAVFNRYRAIYCFHASLFKNLKGVEVGGPSRIFECIYSACNVCDGINFAKQTIWGPNLEKIYSYNGRVLGKQIIQDATKLNTIISNSYDFLLSSNNLEHIANPLKAISEFYRVLKPMGYLLIVVPNKRYTFDHRRKITEFQHILNDYKQNIGEEDMAHLEEILMYHDLDMDVAAGDIENFTVRSKNNFENRCLHHHVFDETLLIQIVEFMKFQRIESGVVDQNYFVLARKI